MSWMLFMAIVLACSALTALATYWAPKAGLLDPLEARRLHTQITPRGGGIGIALLFLLGLIAYSPLTGSAKWLLFVGVAVIMAVGLADDIRSVSALFKLLAQCCGALLVAIALPFSNLPVLAGVCLAAIVMLSTVNVWNFMDGSNGLAASQGAIIALALAWLMQSQVMLLLAAACIGFLPFNTPRPRIFLGDVGSYAIGAGIGVGFLLATNASALSVAQCLLLPSAFLLDAGWTLLLRILGRERFWQAHSLHLYQCAIRKGHSHVKVCVLYALWSLVAALLAATIGPWSGTAQMLIAGIVLLLGSGIYFALLYRWKAGFFRTRGFSH